MNLSGRLPLVVLCVLIAISHLGCSQHQPATGDAGEALQPVVIQLNWHAEAEHGGAYAALASELYSDAGLDVEIRPGGPATPVAADLESGRCQFAFANADDVALYRQQGAGVVAVLAAMQDHPRCILVRRDSNITDLNQLAGLTLQRQPGRPFLEFMRRRGLLDDVQEVPYTGSVAGLVTSKDIAIQAYSFAEPLLAEQQGVEVTPLMVSELGWNPYSSVLVTTDRLIAEDPQLVRKVVEATRQGWVQYLEDPQAANELILKANRQGMTAEALAYGAKQMTELAMPGGAAPETVGQMSLQRWQTLVEQLVELGLVEPENVQAEACFDSQFLSPPAAP
ncbi:ABC transporter substrate-binding protein [Roseimaritima ulvae]|uniref:NMT1/THI5 like protein n=1 Tax=Roseimaritima ulvae TaxID=980254 RepID=A0A5B9R415_9BACT|nr:ABC transporter substrate-binding protein [Roseimaritima ulvae]QEG41053.1 NMT1/THI5 like protein [Roseimaritima ulvae]